MIYINQNKNILKKYEVILNKDKIENLLMKVIKRCGEKHIIKEERIYIPENEPGSLVVLDYNKKNIVYVENVTAAKNGKTTTLYEDYYPYEVDLYNCQYLKYIAPYFAGFISELIYNPNSIIPLLFNQDFSSIKHFQTVEEKLKNKTEEIDQLKTNNISIFNEINNYNTINQLNIIENSIKKLKYKQKELDNLLEIKELNINQEPVTEYMKELLSLVQFKLIDTLNISEIERINSFLEEDIIKINNNKVKKLKK